MFGCTSSMMITKKAVPSKIVFSQITTISPDVNNQIDNWRDLKIKSGMDQDEAWKQSELLKMILTIDEDITMEEIFVKNDSIWKKSITNNRQIGNLLLINPERLMTSEFPGDDLTQKPIIP